MKKKLILLTLILSFMIGCFATPVSAAGMTLDQLKAKFPDGKHWNHKVTAVSNNGDNLLATGNESFANSVTNHPCATHSGPASVGQYDCNYFDGGIQCWGFAHKLGYDYTGGSRPSTWTKKYTLDDLKVGDIVRYGTHSVFVTSVSSTAFTVAEGNYGYDCSIKWGRYITKSSIARSLQWVSKCPVSPSSAPKPPTNVSTTASGTSVTVKWSASAGTSYYNVYLVQSPWGWENIKYTGKTTATSYTFSNVKAGSYCAFVIARPNADSVQSKWVGVTATANVTPAAPSIKANGTELIEGNSLTISWPAAKNATKYQYYIYELPRRYGTSNAVKTGTTTAKSISFKDIPSGYYTCVVYSISSTNTKSKASNAVSFDIRKSDYTASKVIIRDGHLYALYESKEAWDYAEKLCEYFGGHLATITSAKENEVIKELMASAKGNWYWLGAHNYVDSDWNKTNGPWSWVTGESFSYTNWYSGEPSQSGNNATREHFLELRTANNCTWNDKSNRAVNEDGFILEIDNVNPDKPTGMTAWGTSQYKVFNTSMTWTEAEAYCESIGGHLATAETGDEYVFLADLVTSGSKAWYYLGGKRTDTGGNGKWLNGNVISKTDGKTKWSSFNQGDFLFMYKSGSGLGWIKNAYKPTADIKNFGFICEFDGVAVTGVTLDKTALSLTEGNSETLTATIAPADAANKTVIWKSDNTGVATVENGKVTAVKAGTANITATTADGNKVAACEVTVIAKDLKVTGVSLDKTELPMVMGNTEKLTAVVTPEGATNYDLAWKSSDESVATVDGVGNVKAVGVGTAEIIVTVRPTASVSPSSEGARPSSLVEEYTAKCLVIVAKNNPESAFGDDDDDSFRFVDVMDEKAYFFTPVYFAYYNGITKGTDETHFSPGATCTRGQVVTFLWRAKGSPEPATANNPFKDVKSGDYFYKAVLWAVENEITKGTSTTTFSPNEGCTRGQVVTFLHRTEGTPAVSGKNPFTDVKSDDYYYNSVLWASTNGVTSGTSATAFSPKDVCTRAQIVTFLYRDLAE